MGLLINFHFQALAPYIVFFFVIFLFPSSLFYLFYFIFHSIELGLFLFKLDNNCNILKSYFFIFYFFDGSIPKSWWIYVNPNKKFQFNFVGLASFCFPYREWCMKTKGRALNGRNGIKWIVKKKVKQSI